MKPSSRQVYDSGIKISADNQDYNGKDDLEKNHFIVLSDFYVKNWDPEVYKFKSLEDLISKLNLNKSLGLSNKKNEKTTIPLTKRWTSVLIWMTSQTYQGIRSLLLEICS